MRHQYVLESKVIGFKGPRVVLVLVEVHFHLRDFVGEAPLLIAKGVESIHDFLCVPVLVGHT